jgi:hypothetical protein
MKQLLHASFAKISNLRKMVMLMTLVTLLLLTLFALASAQSGGGYDLTWNVLGSGGGSNSGGGYTLNGTLGQPAAGTLNGDGYILVSGFWSSEQIPVGIVVDPSRGGWLIITDTQGLTTTIQIPPGAVTRTTWITITPILLPTEPISPGLHFAGHAFDLDAYWDGQLITNFIFETTVTVTVHYSDADVAGIDEKTLELYRWVTPPGSWQVIGARQGEGQSLDTVNNVLTAWLLGLSHFGNMGVARSYIYLPIVIRDG